MDIIETSTIVFANNFAFGPELDYQLTLRFSRLCEGARVISSKSFCGRTIRMSDRRLGGKAFVQTVNRSALFVIDLQCLLFPVDLSSIIKLSLLDPVNDGVSWTDKPFSYYVHTIDRSPVSRLSPHPVGINFTLYVCVTACLRVCIRLHYCFISFALHLHLCHLVTHPTKACANTFRLIFSCCMDACTTVAIIIASAGASFFICYL